MSSYVKGALGLLLCCLLSLGAGAAPRIVHSSTPGTKAVWLGLKKESKESYQLTIHQEGAPAPEKFKLTADSTGAAPGPLKFAPDDESRAMAALKGYEDIITHSSATDAEATGDAAGDINTFVNGLLRREGAEGLMILPAAPGTEPAPASGGTLPAWATILIGLVLGGAVGFVISRNMQRTPPAKPLPAPETDAEPEKTTATGVDVNTAQQQLQQLKKVQKELKDAKARLAAATEKQTAEAARNTALEQNYASLEAQVKAANATITAMDAQAQATFQQLRQLKEQAAAQEAYFKTAVHNIIRPFTDFVSSNKINPVDPVSQAIVEEQMVVMAFHYYSLVRYGAGIWDEHDMYNVQRNGPLGAAQKAASPEGVDVSVKSGYPNLVLTVAALLRQAGANGAAMDISIRGYRFAQNPA